MRTIEQQIDCLERTVEALTIICLFLMGQTEQPPLEVRTWVKDQLQHFLQERDAEFVSRN